MLDIGTQDFPERPRGMTFALVGSFLATLAMIGLSTALGMQVTSRWGPGAVDLLYLPAVLAAAAGFGLAQGFVAGLGSALAYNFYFTAPVHSFRISRPGELMTVAILFLVAVVTSQLAARMRSQKRAADAQAARIATINGLTRRLLSCSTREEIGAVACHELGALFACHAALVSGVPEPAVIAADPAPASLDASDFAAAAWVLESGEPAGAGVGEVAAQWLFHPVRSRLAIVAAMGLSRDDRAPAVADHHLPLLATLLDQVALALEREALECEMRRLADLRERDRLRDVLLSSVGHDLRTPLTAIIAAAAELRRGESEPALVATVAGEAAKLQRYITNLLDMARIDAGAVRLKTEAVDLVDAVSAALRDLDPALEGHTVAVAIPADLPLVRTDPHLLHHCLINLLDNAARHSGAGAPIRLVAAEQEGDVILSIEDEGVGLAAGASPFETFAQFRGSDQSGGTGLGLAIVQGFSAALGIAATARNREPHGAAFALRFPRSMTMAGSEVGDGE